MAAHYEPGEYDCKVLKQGFGESDEKKTPFFFLEVMPDGGQYSRTIKLWLTQKTIDNTVEKLRNLGWYGSSFSELEPGGQHSFVGDEIVCECHHETNNGDVYDKFDLPYVGSKVEHKAGMTKNLDKLFGTALKPTARKAAPVESPAVQSSYPDDIPF